MTDSGYASLQAKFQTASQLAGSEFDAALKRAAHSWYPARHLIETAVKSRKTYNSTGKLIVFDDFAPWKVRQRLPGRFMPTVC